MSDLTPAYQTARVGGHVIHYTKPKTGAIDDPLVASRLADQLATVNKAPREDLVAMAHQIQHADAVLKAQVGSKLATIAEQIRRLQEEARKVMTEAVRDTDLHKIPCNFKRRPGQIYHVYTKPSGERYLSMLSPAEWGGKPPHTWGGSYRLEADQSWTPVEKVAERDAQYGFIEHLLGDNMIVNGPLFAPQIMSREADVHDATATALLHAVAPELL
eukprot:Colp12_sorted_trinity150504_noHs@16279